MSLISLVISGSVGLSRDGFRRKSNMDLLRIPLAPALHFINSLLSGQMRIQFQELLDCLFVYGFFTHVLQYVPEII